jgi:hypothetical protein
MPELYSCYIQLKVRKVIAEKDVPFERACHFFNNKGAVVSDSSGNFYKTKEELKDAQSIRPTAGIELNSSTASFGTLSEDPDRELPLFTRDTTE